MTKEKETEQKPWLIVPKIPKGSTYEEMVEGKKRNPIIQKCQKATLSKAQTAIKKGAKTVEIMLIDGVKVNAKVAVKGDDYALLTVKDEESYGIDI